MKKTLSLILLAALALPACTPSNSNSDKKPAEVKVNTKKVRGFIDASAGVVKTKSLCNTYSEIYKPSDEGPMKITETNKMESLITETPQSDGSILRERKSMETWISSEYEETFYSQVNIENHFKQTLQEDGWILEEGDVRYRTTDYAPAGQGTDEWTDQVAHYTEVFRFEGDKRITKSLKYSDKDETMSFVKYVSEVSPTRSIELSFQPAMEDRWYTNPEGDKIQPYKVLRETTNCEIDIVE